MDNAGERAESAVVEYLKQRGYKVIARNWRNIYSEIDKVAKKKRRIHCVEVKYRFNLEHGDGFDYITADKRRRLLRATAAWATENEWTGDIQIDVAAVTGKDFTILYVENAVEGN